jgi:nucleotide-binding universal stress UspA family protein
MFDVIIWASDGSEHADRALNYARELAEANSARLTAVHVREVTVGRAAGYPAQIDEDEVERKIQGQAKDLKDSGINANYERWARRREAPRMRWPTRQPTSVPT